MNKEIAIAFLRTYQPMPDDQDLSDELIRKYSKVRKYFKAHPTPDCIPLFLNSFGNGTVSGQYQLVADVLTQFENDKVVPHLAKALTSDRLPQVSWAAEISAYFPSPNLVPALKTLATHTDVDIRLFAIVALDSNQMEDLDSFLTRLYASEEDELVLEILEDIMDNRGIDLNER